jgi:integrase
VRLRNADIDLGTGTIHVEEGKGVAGGRTRKAYVSPDLRAILREYDRERQKNLSFYERPDYFVSAKTGKALSLEGLRKIVEKIRRASGVDFSAHTLRHSFVTHLLRSDVPLHIVRDLAGHRNIATTLGYLRVFDEDLSRNIGKMRFR